MTLAPNSLLTLICQHLCHVIFQLNSPVYKAQSRWPVGNLCWNYSLLYIPGIFVLNWILMPLCGEYFLCFNTLPPPPIHTLLSQTRCFTLSLDCSGPQGIWICNSSIYYLCKFNTKGHCHSLKPHHKLMTADTERRLGRYKQPKNCCRTTKI